MAETNLCALVADKIVFGEELINSLNKYSNIDGTEKLQRKVKQELNFLKKILKNGTVKKEHLQCSNLTHFSALLQVLTTVSGCTGVNKVFYLDDRKLTVDIVCDGGLTWCKVVARNPKSLHQISMGDASFGVRSIVDQAEEFTECAKLYPCLFRAPQVKFVFTNGISVQLAQQLEELGITVLGKRLSSFNNQDAPEIDDLKNEQNRTESLNTSTELSTKGAANIAKVNLDVSAMLAYVSSVTNGSCTLYEFSVPVLKQQAEWERERPQKCILDKFFAGKKLYCCETAKKSFEEIVSTVGGPGEKARAEEFLKRITVLPDSATANDTFEVNADNEIFHHVQFSDDKILQPGGKIRERSLIIFTFGDRIQAVTVTANDGFVRAAKQQGINFVVFVHESRALTEQKELTKAIRK